MAAVAFIFLCIVWGTTWIAIKITLQGMPPFLGAAARFSVAVFLLSGLAILKGINLKMPARIFKILFITALLMYILDYGLVYWGEQYLSAGVTAIFFATFPIFTGIFSTLVVKSESSHWTKFVGLLIGFIGITVTFYDQLLKTHFESKIIFATLAIVLGAAGGALATVLVKKYLSEINSVSLSLHQMIWGVVGLSLFGLFRGEFSQIHPDLEVVLAVLYLGAIGSALAFVLYYWLLKKIGAISLSVIIYVTPIVALFADWLYFGEKIGIRTVIGMLLIFTAIALTQLHQYRAYLRKKALIKPTI